MGHYFGCVGVSGGGWIGVGRNEWEQVHCLIIPILEYT